MTQPSTLSRVSSGSLASETSLLPIADTSLTTAQKEKSIDQYLEISPTQVANEKLIEPATSDNSLWWLAFTPLALLAVTGCSDGGGYDGGLKAPYFPPTRDASNSNNNNNNSQPDAGTGNRAPVFGSISNQTIDEGQHFQFPIPVSDPDGDILNVTANVLTGSTYPGGATVTIDSLRNFIFDWQPDYDQAGNYGVMLVAYDGKTQANANMQITVREVPLDNDGDGFNGDVDCDDGDENIFPLRDDQALNVTESVTICPGTYERVRLNLINVNGITVSGNGVVIDAGGVFKDDDYDGITGIISLNNAHHSALTGFEIKNYGDGYAAARLDRSDDNTVQALNIHEVFDNFSEGILGSEGGVAIFTVDSSNNRIVSTNVSGELVIISITGENSYGNFVGDVEVNRTTGGRIFLDAAVFMGTQNSVVENSVLNGSGILVIGSGVTIRNNIIGNAGEGIALISGGESNVIGNRVNNGTVGVKLYDGSDNNSVTNNDLRLNGQCYEVQSGSTGNTISGNQCN